MKEVKYITTRSLENGKGKVRVVVFKDEPNIAYVKYKCPKCGYESELKKEWKRPFYFNCEKCNHKISVPRLLYEIKKK